MVEDSSKILSSTVASQLDVHARFGGVVPELASREHLRAIVPVVREALETAGCRIQDLDAIAATQGPGLVGSLLVGLTYAKALAVVHRKPLITVHHLEGHIHAALLDAEGGQKKLEFPALALIASGGHTHLFECLGEGKYRLEGRTRDDAAGEAYDKVGKLLGFGYPGGPVLDALAPYGNPRAVRFTSPRMKGNESDFSFSGLKTAVLRWFEAKDRKSAYDARMTLFRQGRPTVEQWLAVTDQETLDLIASFQYTVIDELLWRGLAAAERIGAHCMVVSGGVASNRGLRDTIAARKLPFPVYFPTPRLSTDNGVMIAAAAFPRFHRGEFADLSAKVLPNLPLG